MVKKIFSWIGYIFSGILLLFIIYVIIMCSTKKEVELFGRKLYVVKTGSMVPTIEVDTVILVKDTDVTSLDNSTIITFDFNDMIGIPNTHRIVGYYYKYNENGKEKFDSVFDYNTVEEFLAENPGCEVVGYRTQGDNPQNAMDFDPVLFESIHGVYVKNMVIITFLYGLLTNFFGFLLLIMIPLFIILVSQLVSFYKLRQEEKLEKEIKNKEKEIEELKEKIKEEALKEYLEKENK